MVEKADVMIGLDHHDGQCYMAHVERKTGRPEVKALVSVGPEELSEHELPGDACLVYSVPDDLVTVKKITLGEVAPDLVDSAARFELTQSLLEDEDEFCFDIIPTAQENQFLGTIVRRERAVQLITSALPDHLYTNTMEKEGPVPCRSRAIALGMGYLTFCHRDAGELICLADFTDRLVSVCFIHHDNIVGLDRLMVDRFDLTSDAGIGKMAVEFKTMINFKLTSLFDNGVTVPLAALLINRDPESGISRALGEFFPDIVGVPRINTGFFSDSSGASSLSLPDYLVALGLTVK